jgi:hypothetical protein
MAIDQAAYQSGQVKIMTDDIPEFSDSEFSKFYAKKLRNKKEAVDDKRTAETSSMRAEDGRIKTTVVKDRAQLNVRVIPDLKNEVIEEARASGRAVGEVVEEALRQYFKNKRAG